MVPGEDTQKGGDLSWKLCHGKGSAKLVFFELKWTNSETVFFGERTFPSVYLEEWGHSVDIAETKNDVVVKAELPGLGTKYIEVGISGDILTIKGEKKKKEEDKIEKAKRKEIKAKVK